MWTVLWKVPFIKYFQICFLCMKTRFGLFSRGTRCEMCSQVVCSKCFNKVEQCDDIISRCSHSNFRWGFLSNISPLFQSSLSVHPAHLRSLSPAAWWPQSRTSRRRSPPSPLISLSSTPPPQQGAPPPPQSTDGRCPPPQTPAQPQARPSRGPPASLSSPARDLAVPWCPGMDRNIYTILHTIIARSEPLIIASQSFKLFSSLYGFNQTWKYSD